MANKNPKKLFKIQNPHKQPYIKTSPTKPWEREQNMKKNVPHPVDIAETLSDNAWTKWAEKQEKISAKKSKTH
jgi:hypothetical protein